MKVLVTGGAGYIGSITASALEEYGHTPVILDSLLTGPLAFTRNRIFYAGDIADRALIRKIVEEHPDIECTIHMAARIVVPESVARPYEYYRDNVAKSLELFDQLVQLQRPRVIFSSSASVYAAAKDFEVFEDSPLNPLSPYARTKHIMEMILADLAASTQLAGDYPAIFQSDRVRSSPALWCLCAHSITCPWSDCDGSSRAARGLHGDWCRLPNARRHRATRLHPRVGSCPGTCSCGGTV